MLRGAFRLLSRAVPYLGTALLAYDLYNAVRDAARGAGRASLMSGFAPCGSTCPAPPGVDQLTGGNSSFCPAWICTTTEALSPLNDGNGVNPSWGWIIKWHRNVPGDPGIVGRYSNIESFVRPISVRGPANMPHFAPPIAEPFPDPYTVGDPLWQPSPDALPIPMLPPAVDPFVIPPFSPDLVPAPLPWRVVPYRVPNPNRDPREQPRRGPRSPRRPRPGQRPSPQDEPLPSGAGQPGPTVVVRPDGRVDHRPASPTLPKRPKRPERERKLRTGLAGAVRHALNAATEGADLVEAIWKAIPYKDRIRYHEGLKHPSPQAQAMAIYAMWDKVDWEDALWNIIDNEAEDRAWGGLGQALKKGRNAANPFSPNTGRGYQSGPWDTPIHPTSNHW